MNLCEAARSRATRIRRRGWKFVEYLVSTDGADGVIWIVGTTQIPYQFTNADLTANDWEEYKEPEDVEREIKGLYSKWSSPTVEDSNAIMLLKAIVQELRAIKERLGDRNEYERLMKLGR